MFPRSQAAQFLVSSWWHCLGGWLVYPCWWSMSLGVGFDSIWPRPMLYFQSALSASGLQLPDSPSWFCQHAYHLLPCLNTMNLLKPWAKINSFINWFQLWCFITPVEKKLMYQAKTIFWFIRGRNYMSNPITTNYTARKISI